MTDPETLGTDDVQAVERLKDGYRKIREELGKVIEQNLMPQFEYMHNKFESIDRSFDKIDGRFVALTNVLQAKKILTGDDKRLILS